MEHKNTELQWEWKETVCMGEKGREKKEEKIARDKVKRRKSGERKQGKRREEGK